LIFINGKNIFTFETQYILIDLNWIFPIEPSEFKISISVKSYDDMMSYDDDIAMLPKSA